MALFVPPQFWRPAVSSAPDDPIVARVRDVLTSSIGVFLDPDRLQALATDLGCAERNRKHHSGLLADALILSALQHGPDTQGRWLDAHALYERLGGGHTCPSAFGEKVRALEPMFRVLLRRRVIALGEGNAALQGRLRGFADVLIPDGCAFKIAAALAGVWPGTSTPAEFKLHAVYSVRAGGPADLRTSAGRVHDNDGFDPASWVRDALYIWDLGYQDTDRFVDAVMHGAVPLQRLKDKHNPVALAWYDATGIRHALTRADGRAMRLQEACEFAPMPTGGALDLDLMLRDARGREVVARAVCVPCEDQDRWYLTALPRDRFTPFDVAEIYRVRWEVERFFRTLRGAVRLDEVRRLRNPVSMQVALMASMIAATLGQELTSALNARQAQPCETEDEPARGLVPDARPTIARCEPAPHTAGFSPRSARLDGPRVRTRRAR